jgi:hypothetical protein
LVIVELRAVQYTPGGMSPIRMDLERLLKWQTLEGMAR